MENTNDTNLDLFHPKKRELMETAEKFKDLKINGIEDKAGYKLVHEAQMTLRNLRTNINKTRLAYTKQFDDAKKSAIELEKELLDIITPIEDNLKTQKEIIDAEKERIRQEDEEKKRKFIQDRVDILKSYEFFDFDFYAIGMMSEEGFKELCEKKKVEFEEKQDKIKQEENERKEKEAIEKAENEAKEKEEQEKLDKQKKYQAFLKKHEGQFDKIVKEDGKVVLYKNVAEFII